MVILMNLLKKIPPVPTVVLLFSDQTEIEPLRFFVDEVTILLIVFWVVRFVAKYFL